MGRRYPAYFWKLKEDWKNRTPGRVTEARAQSLERVRSELAWPEGRV